ncbi:hypothetical protein FHS18_006107 [Paenibacillus phyllosphaerae]|uniref:SIR2-like domain-containing protein n=1 Tax=Paenibacillus phyllosphaerae TaxID=274593 RepID=A0A7W5B5G9_9BACL|nr:SIR2 family protein [Paenibacillus phyllosphaerae]MBB3113991.1 hypothetical protein [Paenibacillus phyllosphaerae]
MKQQIIDAIKENKLLLFIGAGFSQPLGFPSWNELISLVLKELAEEDNKYNILADTLSARLLTSLEVLDKIKDKKKLVYEVLDRENDKPLENLNIELHRKLGRISSRIITTNYDRLIETATGFKKVVFDNTFHIAKLHDKDNFLLKLHGCIENPDTCILFQEKYEDLYKETAAIEKLKSLIADHTILFIGFSLSDDYVRKQFEYIHSIYKGFSKQHFYLTVDNSATEIHGVHPVFLKDWGDMGAILDSLIEVKESAKQTSVATITAANDESALASKFKEKEVSIALLSAAPIDSDREPLFETVTKPLSKFKVNIECFYFNIEVLRNLEGFDYIIILSQTVKDKIIIEDQYLKSKLITPQEIEENLITDDLKGIIIFIDKPIQISVSQVSIPLLMLWEEDLSSVFFKLFQKKTLNRFENSILFNPEKFNLTVIQKGVSTIVTRGDNSKRSLADSIDTKNLINFVGRKTDLEDVTRKIIDTSRRVLTIKGSGGIGKTTTVKKVALELFDRGLFSDGIFFIDCEFITNYKNFEYRVAQCFGIESTINLKEHVQLNNIVLNAMIILDNFEPMLYIDDEDEVKSLLAFVCDYVNVVITSREWVRLEFEECHELRAFTIEEAFELFSKYYKSELNIDEIKMLKDDILSRLLNNNPLAIKITAKNLPKSKNMIALKEELEKDFFNITKDGYEDIFDERIDANIERSKSLYQSIAYSYYSLTTNEKLLFELLSLFPDGIHMNNIKSFFSQGKYKLDSRRITDRDITSLENKSLIEINRGFIELQSIIGRFAEYQFQKRPEEEKRDFHKRAFDFIGFLIDTISSICEDNQTLGLEIFDQNIENFIKSLDYFTYSVEDQDKKLRYILKVDNLFDYIEQGQHFYRKLKKLKSKFTLEKSDILIDVIIASSKYRFGKFKEGYDQIKQTVSIEDMYKLDHTNMLDRHIIIGGLHLYDYSDINEVRRFIIKSNFYSHGAIVSMLYNAGEYKKLEALVAYRKLRGFHYLEMKYNMDKLDYDELEAEINGLYRKQYIEIMQTHYIKAKMGKLDRKSINKLVVTNSYTSGIKSLMLAFTEKDHNKTILYYESAVNDLQPIRYYYTEAIYFYAGFLLANGLDESMQWYNKGLLLAKDNHYRFLYHKFICLKEGLETPYDEDQYNLPVEYLLDELIEKNKDEYYSKYK